MACDGEHADLIRIIGVLSVEVVKVVSPQIFDVSRVDPAVTIGAIFDEHHGWKAVNSQRRTPSNEYLPNFIDGVNILQYLLALVFYHSSETYLI